MEGMTMNSDELKANETGQILARLKSLEERVALLESGKNQFRAANYPPRHEMHDDDSDSIDFRISISAPFETRIGEYGLAWLGNIVLFFAIAFLMQFFSNDGKPFVSMVVGLASVGLVFILSHYFRKEFTSLSFIFNLFGYILLFYTGLRLHYYTAQPLLDNRTATTFVLLLLIGFQLRTAIKKHSQVLAGLAYAMALITAFACNYTHAFFLISIATGGMAMYTFRKYNWYAPLIIILILGFFSYLTWLLKNPVSLVKSPADLTYHYTFIYFSVTTAIYSFIAFRKPDTSYPENFVLTVILLAGLTYSMLMLVLVFWHFTNAFVPFFVAISIYCIIYSIILKIYSPWKYSPALYALFGFVSISVSICGIYHFPDSFLLLTWQSVLVLALSLWYRSHIIALMNTFLLLILMLTYYNLSGTIHSVNFSIPLVAFISARTINWQKERLNIKTDFIRNIYLLTLFFSFLYATYKFLPGQYITVSWLAIAGIYFALSILVKSVKYRWMAMANLLVSAFYLFLVDMDKIDLFFRILAFLAFAVISLVISTYYVKKLKKRESNPSDGENEEQDR